MDSFENKKKMPTITTYLSDQSDDNNVDLDAHSNGSPENFPKNYAEWKKAQQTDNKIKFKNKNGTKKNGKRTPRVRSDGSLEPLGDISSSEDESLKLDDSETLYNLYQHIRQNRQKTKNGIKTKRKKCNPSKFLLYCRLKQEHYQSLNENWSFSEVCRLCQASWERMSDLEMEEFTDNQEQRLLEYQDQLYKLKAQFNNQSPLTNNASGNSTTKSEVEVPTSSTITKSSNKQPENEIPERLQSLAGTASVYHHQQNPETAKLDNPLTARHSVFAYRRLTYSSTSPTLISSSNDLMYVNEKHNKENEAGDDDDESLSATSDEESEEIDEEEEEIERCRLSGCNKTVIYDSRWEGSSYCSVECLMNHCKSVFEVWLKSKLNNKNNNNKSSDIDTSDEDVEDVVNFLTRAAAESGITDISEYPDSDSDVPPTNESSVRCSTNPDHNISQNQTPTSESIDNNIPSSDVYSPPMITSTITQSK